MDYLSGGQNLANGSEKMDEFDMCYQPNLSFYDFCNVVLGMISPDERALLNDKFLSAEVISIMKDKELIDCINAFLNNNLNISETSRNAFLHRNTLLYRIDKIHKTTGLNVRKFEDAMTFRILNIIYEKITKEIENK